MLTPALTSPEPRAPEALEGPLVPLRLWSGAIRIGELARGARRFTVSYGRPMLADRAFDPSWVGGFLAGSLRPHESGDWESFPVAGGSLVVVRRRERHGYLGRSPLAAVRALLGHGLYWQSGLMTALPKMTAQQWLQGLCAGTSTKETS